MELFGSDIKVGRRADFFRTAGLWSIGKGNAKSDSFFPVAGLPSAGKYPKKEQPFLKGCFIKS
jgi:hypothetical protein